MTSCSPTPREFYVYLHSRLHTGEPFYVGKGKGSRAKSASGRNRYWSRIVKKDGGFHVSILAGNLDEEFAMLLEIEAIDLLRRKNAALVNMTDGGDGASGHSPSDETRAKLSASSATKGKPAWNRGLPSWNRGVKQPPELLEKLSKIRTGKKLTDDHKAKISAANKGIMKTAEWRQKLSVSHKGRPTWSAGKNLTESHRRNISNALLKRNAEIRAAGVVVEQIDSLVQKPGTRPPRRGELVDVKTFPQQKKVLDKRK